MAFRASDTERIPTRGTAFLVLAAQTRGLIDADEALETVDELPEAGWYCALDRCAEIRGRIETVD